MYSIYTLKKNIWHDYATVNGDVINFLTTFISNELREVMTKVVQNIVRMEAGSYDNFIVSAGTNNEHILFGLVGVFRYRRGSAYYGIQYAEYTKQIRLLVFPTDKMHHSGGCFGTSPITLDIPTLLNDIKNEMREKIILCNFDTEILERIMKNDYIVGI